MHKLLVLPIALASITAGAAASEAGTPIPEALADKPTPLPIYEMPRELVFDAGHKNVPLPAMYSAAFTVPISYDIQGFQGLGAYHHPAEVVLGIDSFQAWKREKLEP